MGYRRTDDAEGEAQREVPSVSEFLVRVTRSWRTKDNGGDRTRCAPPSDVVVYETDDGDIVVSAVNPKQLVDVADSAALDDIASNVCKQPKRVLSAATDKLESIWEVCISRSSVPIRRSLSYSSAEL